MPLLRVNMIPAGYVLHASPQCAARRVDQLAQGDGPVILMIHGYKYTPAQPSHCPHSKLFCFANGGGWSDALVMGPEPRHGALCIGLGWPARGSLRDVHKRAGHLASALAALVGRLRESAPHRPVHVIAHSLGSELALATLPLIAPGHLHRMILLTGATHRGHATQMLATPAGQVIELFNVTSRENDLFDLCFERLVPGDGAIGRGIHAPNAVNLQMDCAQSLCVLESLGLQVAPPDQRISHWSVYTRPGAMAFYARALHQPDTLPIGQLRQMLPGRPAPHYSRLWSGRKLVSCAQPDQPSLARAMKTRIMEVITGRESQNEHAY